MTPELQALLDRAAALAHESGATALSLTYSPQLRVWTVEAWSQVSDPVLAADGARIRLTATHLETGDHEHQPGDALAAFCRLVPPEVSV